MPVFFSHRSRVSHATHARRAKHARVKIDQQPDAFLCFAVRTTRERTPRSSLSIAHFDPRVFSLLPLQGSLIRNPTEPSNILNWLARSFQHRGIFHFTLQSPSTVFLEYRRKITRKKVAEREEKLAGNIESMVRSATVYSWK